MKKHTIEKGSSVIIILAIMFILNSLLFLSLNRSESAFRLVKNRYLGGVAQDMAENGVAFEQLMISKKQGADSNSPHRREMGMFADYAGSFESFFKPLKQNTFEIISRGKLVDRTGKMVFLTQITATTLHTDNGQWKIIYWSEHAPKPTEVNKN